MWCRLQPDVAEAAAPCGGGCSPMRNPGRRFATTGRLGDVAVHNVTPGSVAGFGGDSRWTVPAQAHAARPPLP